MSFFSYLFSTYWDFCPSKFYNLIIYIINLGFKLSYFTRYINIRNF